jgi:hypothetical protein
MTAHASWSREFFTEERCPTCKAAGSEQVLKELIINEPGLSAIIVRCPRDGYVCTRASAIGLRARTELLKARRSARTRATTFMLIGAFLTLAMIGIAATAFAALK